MRCECSLIGYSQYQDFFKWENMDASVASKSFFSSMVVIVIFKTNSVISSSMKMEVNLNCIPTQSHVLSGKCYELLRSLALKVSFSFEFSPYASH